MQIPADEQKSQLWVYHEKDGFAGCHAAGCTWSCDDGAGAGQDHVQPDELHRQHGQPEFHLHDVLPVGFDLYGAIVDLEWLHGSHRASGSQRRNRWAVADCALSVYQRWDNKIVPITSTCDEVQHQPDAVSSRIPDLFVPENGWDWK